MTTPGEFVGSAEIRVDADTGPAMRAINQFSRDAQSRLRDLRGRFVSESALINRSLTNAVGGSDRFGRSLRALTAVAGRASGALGTIASTLGRAGATAPLLAGIVTTLQNVAPAGAVAVSGMLAVQQASAAVRLGMVGVEDAVTAAFDTSKEGAKAFQESLENLSPSARAFAQQVRDLAPSLTQFQQSVQEELFTGFDKALKQIAEATLPVLKTNLTETASTLRAMAVEAAGAARQLATDGLLGKAMAGANRGLRNLEGIPARVVTALGQLAVAGAPALDRLTLAASDKAAEISDWLSAAFASGALQEAVDTAVGFLLDLGTAGENVFAALGNVVSSLQAAGSGLIGILVQITEVLRDVTGTQVFQSAIGALAEVMVTLARTAGPLLGRALSAIAPVFIALGPPIERLITALGAALSPILTSLQPVLAVAAAAVGLLIDAVSPLLPVIGNLVSAVLPPLVPLLLAVGDVIAQASPVVQLLGEALRTALAPILAQLPAIITPVANLLTMLTKIALPVLAKLVVAISPALASIGQSFGQLLAAVAPLLEILGELVGDVLIALMPLLTPIIALVGQLAAVFASQLGNVLNNVVVPALNLVTALLKGDFTGAWNALKTLIGGVVQYVITAVTNMGSLIKAILTTLVGVIKQLPGRIFAALSALADGLFSVAKTAWNRFRQAVISGATTAINWIRTLPGKIRAVLSGLAAILGTIARSALNRFTSAVRSGVANTITLVRGIPGRIRGALGRLAGLLVGAGRDLIRGMINGIKQMAGSLVSAARGVINGAINGAKSLLGISSPSKVFAAIGRDTGRGFIKGLTGTQAQIKSTSERIIGSITRAFRGRNTRVDDRLVSLVQSGNKKLQGLAKQRDEIAKKIADAQKLAADLASRARATGGLGSIVSADFAAPKLVKQRMRDALAQIKQFTADVQKLAKKGVNKDLLRQILELGPEQGAAFAQALAEADKSTIKEFNDLNKQISSASSKLGKTGADLLYDSGKKAGEGFLTGLKAQRKKIEQLMLDIAKGMQKAIRKALGIKSPSRVMAEVGKMTVLGLSGGITATASSVDQAMARVTDAVTAGVPDLLPTSRVLPRLEVGSMRATSTTAPTTVHITLNLDNNGVIGSRIEVENWFARALDQIARTGRSPVTLRAA